MSGRRLACVLVAVGLLAATPVAAHQQLREAARGEAGTASITGTVVTGEAMSRPLARAVVTVASGASTLPQAVSTDEAGRFVFTGLTPGTYYLVVTKPGYVETAYGATHVGMGLGVPLALLAGQSLSGLTIDLPHGAVLTGAIRFASGLPDSAAMVEVRRIDLINGHRRPSPDVRTTVKTDDRGVYRAFGLAPGTYLIQSGGTLESSLFGAVEVRQVSADEVRWAERAIGTPSGPAAPGAAGPPPPSSRPTAYAAVYYPGTGDLAAAALVTVGLAEERTGLDFVMTAVPTAVVSGHIIGLEGGPPTGATLVLNRIEAEASDLASAAVRTNLGPVLRDGSFRVPGVAPGHYRLTARAMAQAVNGDAAGAIPRPMIIFPGAADGATLWGQEEVTVEGQDLDGVTIRLQPGLSVSGRVAFETATPPDVSQVRVMLGTTEAGNSPADMVARLLGGLSSGIGADGTFSIPGLTPDRYRLTATTGGLRNLAALIQPGMVEPALDAIVLKSALWHGVDLADVPLDLKPGVEATGIVLTFTDKPTTLRGTVRDATGRPTPNFPILVFATDRAAWFAGSRRVVGAHVASDGQFTIRGLPAGEYYIAALTDVSATELTDPTFLEAVVPSALRLTLADGEQKVQDLKLAGGGLAASQPSRSSTTLH
jgi:hypothetical protein